MDKIKIVFSYLAYPFTMANYFRRALERRNDIELYVVGAFTGQQIPWAGGMTIPMKYPNQVDMPLPPQMLHPSWAQIESSLPWKPDLSLTVDAGWSYSTKPNCLSAHVATDPHVLDYSNGRKNSDFFFNMQLSYMQEGDILLPYAFDPKCHYPNPTKIPNIIAGGIDSSSYISQESEFHCSIIGLHYPQRDEWVRRLREHGVKVNYRIGDIYDEYREENNKAWIGLNWSSLQDVTARVFEIMAMRLVPIINRLPGLQELGFEDGRHYLGFSNMDEAVAQVQGAIENRPFAEQIALNAYQFVNNSKMTYDQRVSDILKTVGLI